MYQNTFKLINIYFSKALSKIRNNQKLFNILINYLKHFSTNLKKFFENYFEDKTYSNFILIIYLQN